MCIRDRGNTVLNENGEIEIYVTDEDGNTFDGSREWAAMYGANLTIK